MIRRLIFAGLLAVSPFVCAQQTPAKKELIGKVLSLQQTAIDAIARGLAEQPLAQMMPAVNRALQTQVPSDKRESASKAVDAEVRKYLDEAVPLLRERATKMAPVVLGPLLEEKFNENELRQLVAWLESPVNQKYQQVAPALHSALVKQLVTDTREAIEPKLKALDARVAASLGVVPKAAAAKPASSPASKAKP